jgi:hypothetical protein
MFIEVREARRKRIAEESISTARRMGRESRDRLNDD